MTVGENMFVIHPDSASTAAFPDPECPAEAIFADSDIPSDLHWLGPPDTDAWNILSTSKPNISVRNAASAKAQASGLAPDPLPRSPAADDRTLERPKEKYEHVQCH